MAGPILTLVLLGLLFYWIFVVTEGAYLGARVVAVGSHAHAGGPPVTDQHDGGSAVPEDDTHVPAFGGNIEPGTVNLGSDEKHFFSHSAADIGIGRAEAVDEAGTLLANINGGCRFQAKFALKYTTGTRKKKIRR